MPLPRSGRLALLTGALLLAFAAPAGAAPLVVSVHQNATGPPVPADFLGLSYEVKELPRIAGYAQTGNFVHLLRHLGHGVIRFGGVTADSQTAWAGDGRPRPEWANSVVTPDDLVGLAGVVHGAGWRTLLDVNLGHFDDQAAASEVATANADLGTGLAGIELGNEPNAYGVHGLRPQPWRFDGYRSDVEAYRQAIEAAAPGVPIAGPGASSGHLDWIYAEAAAVQPALLTAHFYSLGCHSAIPSDVSHLLGPFVLHRLGYVLTRFGRAARATGIPLRISETNNVSCGGRGGVSNSFASALWASDLMVRAIGAGLAGVNFHGSLTNCRGYTPLCAPTPQDAATGTLTAQPEWYALLLVRRLLGDRPLRTFVQNPRQKVTVVALAAPGGRMHVVVIDARPHHDFPLRVVLRAPRRLATGTIMRLTARLPSSTAGVTLGGRAVQPDGTWRPAPRLPHVGGAPGALTLTVPAGSAALVTLRPR